MHFFSLSNHFFGKTDDSLRVFKVASAVGVGFLVLLKCFSEADFFNVLLEGAIFFRCGYTVDGYGNIVDQYGYSCVNLEGMSQREARGAQNGSDWYYTSTPFLAVKRSGNFVIENDVMFGKPNNVFPTKDLGFMVEQYAPLLPDTYHIRTPFDIERGKIHFQIREIEPEESFVRSVLLERVSYPKDGTFFVDASLRRTWVFSTAAVVKGNGTVKQKIYTHKKKDVTDVVGTRIEEKLTTTDFARATVHMMETEDWVELTATVTDRSAPLYLLLGSNYHDWVFSQLERAKIQTKFGQTLLRRCTGVAKALAMVILAVPIWAVSSFVTHFNGESDDLAKKFNIPEISADIPAPSKSLRLEYKVGKTYQSLEVVFPRYYQNSFDVVKVPDEAIDGDGTVTVRITATKRHNLVHASYFVAEELPVIKKEQLSLTSAVHARTGDSVTDTLTTSHRNRHVHLVPGDIVDLTFDAPIIDKTSADETTGFVLSVAGFYTPLSTAGEHIAGINWQDDLDPVSKVWLEEMKSMT
jgi:hypothetical protein